MKKILILIMFVSVCAGAAWGAVDVSPYRQVLLEMCGAGWLAQAITEIEGYPAEWRAASAHGEIVNVASANILADIMEGSRGITKTLPRGAIVQFLDKLNHESLQYGSVYVDRIYAPPTGCSVVGSNIECDVPPAGKTLVLFSWDTVSFTDTEAAADVDGDFDGLASGTYVVSFEEDDAFGTTYLTVP